MLEVFSLQESPFTGVLFHAIGGLAAASFLIPYKKVKTWPWEIYWLIGGVFSWLIAPWLFSFILVPNTLHVLTQAPASSVFWTFIFGLLWGVGGLTFGLTMRYLGIALGYALALGISAVVGTLIPPIFAGELLGIASTMSGQVMLSGVFICVLGIVLGGKAGTLKQNELSKEQKQQSLNEFNFTKGVALALFSGVMSAFMAYAFAAGKPIADLALTQGADKIWQNLPVLIVILSGGFVTNAAWCVYIANKNKSWSRLRNINKHEQHTSEQSVSIEVQSSTNQADDKQAPIFINTLFCALAGSVWYLQFFFYGIGTTMMGQYEFSSWTLHMASIIVFSTIWGLALKEWQGTSVVTRRWNLSGLAVLIISMVVIGWGNTLAT